MSNSDLFREEALAHRGKTEPLHGLLRVTAPHEWVIVIGLAVALIAVALWAFLGRIDTAIASDCILAHPGDRHEVISTLTGNVEDILVNVGDTVHTGQPIARLSAPDLGQRLASARARVAALESQPIAPPEALALAHADLHELESAHQTGRLILSPRSGSLTSHSLAPGQALTIGTPVARILLTAADPPLQAVAYLPPDTARRVEPGMEATIATGDPTSRPLAANVASVAQRQSSPPNWLTDFGLSVPPTGHLVTLNLAAPPPQLRDGDRCAARVVLGSHPPIRLLNLFRSN